MITVPLTMKEYVQRKTRFNLPNYKINHESVLMFFDSLKRIGTFVEESLDYTSGESLDYTSRESVYNIQLIYITTVLKPMRFFFF